MLQRAVQHWRRSAAPNSWAEPRDVEELDLFLGVPKIVWVILADVLAVFFFFIGTRYVAGKAMTKQGPSSGGKEEAG